MPFLYFSRNFLCLSPYRLVKSIILDRRPLGHGQCFRFGDNVLENLHELTTPVVAAHCRVGDYSDLGYVVVSRRSYYDACRTFAISYDWLQFCIGLSTPCCSAARHLEAIGREVKHSKRIARKHAKRREFLV